MALRWQDDPDGEFSEYMGPKSSLPIWNGQPAGLWARARQPIDHDRRREVSWETFIVLRQEGLGLSLASSKVDAETALRRDAERIIEALGGKVVWP